MPTLDECVHKTWRRIGVTAGALQGYYGGWNNKAAADYDRAAALGTMRWYHYKARAVSHFELGHYETALESLAKAVELNPQDLSTLRWISLDRVAQCPDESFRSGLLELADKTIEKTKAASAYWARAQLYAAFGQPEKAAADEEQAANSDREAIARCVTTAYAGLGYAGIEPKAFPGMFTAYGTSNRGRGDHTYAWTIQAEEGGLSGAGNLAAYVGGGQVGKALVDSKGLCDFFCEDNTSELFLKLYHALTGFEYTTESMKKCGERIYNLERHVNNIQGRRRVYDAYIPPKMTVPMTGGAHMGRAVNPGLPLFLPPRERHAHWFPRTRRHSRLRVSGPSRSATARVPSESGRQ